MENLWDTYKSADYIDGTKDISNPAFHRSIPVDSIQYLEHEPYKGQWSDALLKGKKAVRQQYSNGEFTPQSAKNYTEKVYLQNWVILLRLFQNWVVSIPKQLL